MHENTPVEISRGYVEISRGGVLKSAGGMLKSAMAPCRNQHHIDNRQQQTIIDNREHKTIKSTIGTKATTVAFKHPFGRFVQTCKKFALSLHPSSLSFCLSVVYVLP